MKKYVMASTKFVGEIIFGFNDDGDLIEFSNKAELTAEQRAYLCRVFPFTEKELGVIKSGVGTEVKLIAMKLDYSFDDFWNAFNYKVGNKPRAEKIWKLLTPGERARIIDFIPKYHRYIMSKKIESTYPETFLNQRRWESVLPAIY